MEIEIKTNSFLNKRVKRQHQQVNREDFNNGKKNQVQAKEEIVDSLSEEETLDLTHPTYQTQPYPNEDEEDKEEKKDFQESSIQLPEKRPRFLSS